MESVVISITGLTFSFASLAVAYKTLGNSTSQSQFSWLTARVTDLQNEVAKLKQEIDQCRKQESTLKRLLNLAPDDEPEERE